MVTNFHDPKRAFAETTDGRLPVTVAGGWIPRHIKGRGHVLLASARMISASVWLAVAGPPAHCYIVDQVAAAMPVLRLLTGAPVVFYCHFPDQLCDPNRAAIGGRASARSLAGRAASIPRVAYRALFDSIEGWTMRAATRVACNSKFSRSVTVQTFPFLEARIDADRDVLYPPINIPETVKPADLDADEAAKALDATLQGRTVVLSINRYERKKNLVLAVKAFAELLRSTVPGTSEDRLLLVQAGGYDPRLAENVDHHRELVELAKSEGIPDASVLFLRSISDDEKRVLLQRAAVVVYTPTGEHFGIVPVEAMAHGVPVVAVASGGPLESVTESKEVGLLRAAEPAAFADALLALLAGPGTKELRAKMGAAAKARCNRLFSLPSFAANLERMVLAATAGVA
jgi:alpha-1,3/alpha-1,6-mannosyltransferase